MGLWEQVLAFCKIDATELLTLVHVLQTAIDLSRPTPPTKYRPTFEPRNQHNSNSPLPPPPTGLGAPPNKTKVDVSSSDGFTRTNDTPFGALLMPFLLPVLPVVKKPNKKGSQEREHIAAK